MAGLIANLAHRRRIGRKSAGCNRLRATVALHRILQKSNCCLAISLLSDKGFQDFTFVIDSPPELMEFTIDAHEHFMTANSDLAKQHCPPSSSRISEVAMMRAGVKIVSAIIAAVTSSRRFPTLMTTSPSPWR
jgi:hypothetical protein